MIAQVGLRLAVVGCSFFTQNRLNAWAEAPEVELIAVCDRDPERAEAARERFHAMTSSPGSAIATEKRFHSHRSRHPHPGRVPCHHGAIENALFASRSGSNPAIVGEDVATIVIRYENGGTRIVDSYASRRLPKPFPQTMLRIEGGQGTIELLEGFHPRVTSKAEWMNGWSSPQSQPGRPSPRMSWRAC